MDLKIRVQVYSANICIFDTTLTPEEERKNGLLQFAGLETLVNENDLTKLINCNQASLELAEDDNTDGIMWLNIELDLDILMKEIK